MGSVRPGQVVSLFFGTEDKGTAKIGQVLTYKGLERVSVEEAFAGDIVAITGVEDVNIGLTVCDPEGAHGLPPIRVDEPTIAMNFQVNTSPLAGAKASTSPAASCASACTASCKAMWRCVWMTPTSRTSCGCADVASCI